MTTCPFDGELRVVTYREPAAVWWECPTCGVSREAVIDEGETS
jgi:hypothetical protein